MLSKREIKGSKRTIYAEGIAKGNNLLHVKDPVILKSNKN